MLDLEPAVSAIDLAASDRELDRSVANDKPIEVLPRRSEAVGPPCGNHAGSGRGVGLHHPLCAVFRVIGEHDDRFFDSIAVEVAVADGLDGNGRCRPIDPVFHTSVVDASHFPDRDGALVVRVGRGDREDRRKQRDEADHEGRPAQRRAICP